jgi:O-antigen/teichoic acid export membrane protein
VNAPHGHARRLASGSIAQQTAQVSGLLAMLAIVTVLARRLSLPELGAYGLLTSIAGYLLIVQNAGASAAVRSMASGRGDAPARAFSTAAALYAAAGLAAGVLVAGLGVMLSFGIDLPGGVAREARIGALLIGAVSAVGWPLTVGRDALRASGMLVTAAVTEIAALAVYAGLVLGLAFGGAPLSLVIGASGTIPLLAGAGCLTVLRARGLPYRFRRRDVRRATARELLVLAGYVSLTEVAAAGIYAADRAILGLLRSSAAVGLFEGPVRAHNLFRSLNAAVTVTALPSASQYAAEGDERRLRELVLRGSRYTLALTVPLAVTGMVLAAPVLEIWLGPRFREGGGAMAILLGHWLVNGCSGVLAAVLIGAGRARELAGYAVVVAVANVALALALASGLGIEGVALATSLPYLALFPYLAGRALHIARTGWAQLAREAFLPAWSAGAALAAALAAVRIATPLDTLPSVLATALLGLGLTWAAFYAVWLDRSERALVRSVAAGFVGR